MKILKIILLIALGILVVIQFIQPEPNVAEADHAENFLNETNPRGEVKAILQESCFDCHSNLTKYPWYNNIAPVSYWLDDHVDHAKGHLNFSEWDSYDRDKKAHKLEEIAEEIDKGEMPLKEYTWMHAEARLSEEQRTALIEWANKTRLLYQLNNRPK